ncbi:type VII secretion AAA-ATPase EccA [Mycobacterium intracellulare]|uniref:type VII secretion AAA-ATPase EccA n=1 Tax=Mycobacterium intracellulare TaxID=1767 RepID=UPI001CDA0809|nr:type VII secretion AAA-ATPase EccA [Mycobacterium intracellulare]MCA2249773.1 type VII secretion AAA-ATPase EccA [Mycobacterium intracellulare]
MTTPAELEYLASLYAAAARTENSVTALERFSAITGIDASACDAWIGRISHGDVDRSTLFRAWYSRRNFGRLASAADLSVVSLNAWVPIGGGFANLNAPVSSPTVLIAGYAISEAAAQNFDDALEALSEADDGDLAAWARAIVYGCGHRWDKVIETLNSHSWSPDPQQRVFSQCAELLHGVAGAHLGLFVEAERRLTTALTAEYSKLPCAPEGAWYLAMVYRATNREDEAVAKLQWLQAQYPSDKVKKALEDPSVRLKITTRERIAERADPWADDPDEAQGPVVNKELLAEAAEQLQRQIGLDAVKEQIADYRASVQMAAVRAAKGLKTSQGSRHMIFSGPPGTGKTTVAQIVALNLAGLGVIKEPKVIPAVGRADLCAEYEGQTAVKTNKLIDRALGGVLFIDEFYTLAQERDGRADPFGKEAIDTLLARMENDRHQLVVIVAGYPDDLDRALQTNDGLRGRFATRIEFPSYTPDEIAQIGELVAQYNDSILSEEARNELRSDAEELASRLIEVRGKTRNALDVASNGRYARQVVEASERARDRRLSELPDFEDLPIEAVQTITVEDLKAGLRNVHAVLKTKHSAL